MIRFLKVSVFLIAAAIAIPSGLMRQTHGQHEQVHERVPAPALPTIQTVVEPGDASPVHCKGHISNRPINKKG